MIMITVTLIGVEPFYVGQISKDIGPALAQIYETSLDNINFYSPECVYVHNGIEQNGYNVLVRVNAPKKVSVLEDSVVHILETYLKDACVNMQIVFYYYSQDNYYEFNNDQYPRFLTGANSVVMEDDEEYYEEDECCCEGHEHEEKEEPYLGNIFEGIEDKL